MAPQLFSLRGNLLARDYIRVNSREGRLTDVSLVDRKNTRRNFASACGGNVFNANSDYVALARSHLLRKWKKLRFAAAPRQRNTYVIPQGV